MARIQYYVHGRGRGHAIRTLSAVAELRERGHDVDVAASGVAAQVLASVPNVRTIELVAPGRGMASAFRRRLGADRQWLRRLHPDVVVSDGDGPSVHAALALGIPRLAVGHGLALVHARVPTVAPPFARWRERLNVGS
ncbi:MAG: glycosyltransferase, partial [Myxococcota bacterium]